MVHCMRTFNLHEAAQFLHMHPEEVRRRAKLGLLPGAKLGKLWVFLEDDLVEHVRSQYAKSQQALQVTPRKGQQLCQLSSAITHGGSISPPHQESVLDVLLKQVTKSRRKSSTIN